MVNVNLQLAQPWGDIVILLQSLGSGLYTYLVTVS